MKNIFTGLNFRFLVLMIFMGSTQVHAQWYDPEKVGKEAGILYGTALEEAQEGRYPEAIKHIDDALKKDYRFVEAYLSRAGIYAVLRDYNHSVSDFETALRLDSVFSETYLLPYSISLAGTGQFERALKAVNAFLTIPKLNDRSIGAANYRKSVFEFALAYAQKHPSGNYIFAPENLGDSVNGAEMETYPSFTIDGSKLIFTRRVKNDEDFFESQLSDGHWAKARPVTGRINTNFNEGAQAISQDGQWLIFTGCHYPEGEGSCDLYIAYRTKKGEWTEPENLGPLINTEFWETAPSLSPDKRDLYFCSTRPGGMGGSDIWVSHRTTGGKWANPVNLGSPVNTKGDEGSPFIHADNQTLYFNSNGHEGYGANDLFISRKTQEGNWTEPENLGYPINTIDDEGSLTVAADGKTSYYASERSDSRGGLDLYKFRLRDDVTAHSTSWVKGKVFDSKTRAGLPSSVTLTDIDTRMVISQLQTDEEGNYLVTLPAGKNYAFNVNRKGYMLYSESFSLASHAVDTPLNVDISLQPIEKGAVIVLKNIFFDFNKFQLKPTSIAELEYVSQFLRENPGIKVLISGYTDNTGKASDNNILSLNRAKAVADYLSENGIEATRLIAKGLGSEKPLASNETESGRALNRRTELSIVSD